MVLAYVCGPCKTGHHKDCLGKNTTPGVLGGTECICTHDPKMKQERDPQVDAMVDYIGGKDLPLLPSRLEEIAKSRMLETVMAWVAGLAPGQSMTIEAHDPKTQADGRWFTVHLHDKKEGSQ